MILAQLAQQLVRMFLISSCRFARHRQKLICGLAHRGYYDDGVTIEACSHDAHHPLHGNGGFE
jgi:hypothetical protein